MIDIAQRIKKMRELRNFTQSHMASALDMTQQNYSRLEAGEIEITVNRLQQIADILKIHPTDIFNFDEKVIFHQNYATFNDGSIGINYGEALFKELRSVYENHLKDLKQENNYLKSLLEKILPK